MELPWPTCNVNNKKCFYGYTGRDDNTLCVDIEDESFIDKDGDEYYIHVEYLIDANQFTFEIFWERNEE